MILFKPEHVALILGGAKTQTRRRWKRRRVKPGAVHNAVNRMFGPPFARLLARRVWQEPLGDISRDDVRAEGYADRGDFLDAFARINGAAPLDEVVWCVEFELATAPADTGHDRRENRSPNTNGPAATGGRGTAGTTGGSH